MSDVQKLLSIIDKSHEFDNIIRKVPIKNRQYRESDSEHSYKLALTCWYIVEKYKLNMDVSLVLKYALAHDFVEIYVGDIDTFGDENTLLSEKEELEKTALEKIGNLFQDFEQLPEIIKKYEAREDAESEFVYIMDTIQPILGAMITNSEYYRARGITYDKYMDFLNNRLSGLRRLPEEVHFLVDELKVVLRERDDIFSVIS